MYIETAHYYPTPTRLPRQPRERYLQYYHDLHKRYNIDFDESTVLTEFQYTFHELGYLLFDKLKQSEKLDEINLMVAAFWAHDFDPDYATIGLHLTYQYHMHCQMFDIIDQGSICSLMALNLIKQYQSNLTINKALCFSLDQTAIPRANHSNNLTPSHSAAAALILNATQTDRTHIQIVDIKLWTEQQLFENKFNILANIIETLQHNNINLEECILICRRNTSIFKTLEFYQHYYFSYKPIEFYYLPLQLGGTPIFEFIHALIKQTKTFSKPYLVYLEQDTESFVTGIMILKIFKRGI